MTSEPLDQYTEICRDAIKSSSAKFGKTFENLLLEILLLYMAIQRNICRRSPILSSLMPYSPYVSLWTEARSKAFILSAVSGIRRAYTMCTRNLVPISPDVPKHLTGKSVTRKLDLTRMAKVMMKENRLPYSMDYFKEIMASTYIAKLIFDRFRSVPNRKLISHTIKELFGWQRKAA